MSSYIIAEAGVNHNGSETMALQLIDAAADAGADAVKFQTFKTESLTTKGAKTAAYQRQETGLGTQFDMLKKLELSDETHRYLAQHCQQRGIEFLSTGFDKSSVDMLLKLGMKRLKVPSGELTNKPYIEGMAARNLPIIMSTGMATLQEVREAISWIKAVRTTHGMTESLPDRLCLLHCTSNYPAPLESVNLRAMQTMANEFKLPVGYSDHTAGILIAPVAIAMGASVIEKHLTLDQHLDGPDHKASIEAHEFAAMVTAIRDIEISLGDGIKKPSKAEIEVRQVVRRSIVLSKDMLKGDVLQQDALIFLRPEGGIPPKEIDRILGQRLLNDVSAGAPLLWSDIQT